MPDKPEVEPKDFDIADLPETKLLIELDGPTSFLLGLVSSDEGFRSKTAFVNDLIGRTILEHLEDSDLLRRTQAFIDHFRTMTPQDQPED